MEKALWWRLPRNLLLLGLVSLFTDMASQMVFPLLPLYLTMELGAGGRIVGLVEGAAEAMASLLKVVSGIWSDRMARRKPFIFFGYGLSSLAKPLFALASTWPVVLLIRITDRVGKGLRSAPRDALLAESVPEEIKGKAFGFHRSMDGLGSMLGALIAFWLLPVLGYQKIFLWSVVPALFVLLAILPLREVKAPASGLQAEKSSSRRLFRLRDFGLLSPVLKRFILAAAVFSFGHFGYAFLMLKAGAVGASEEQAVLYYMLFYLVYSVFGTPAGILSDKWGRRKLLAVGYAMFALISFGLIFAATQEWVLAGFLLYGLFFALIDGAQRAYVSDMAPGHLQGTALGIFHTATGLAVLPGTFLAGLLWDGPGPEATFVYGAVLAVAAFLLLPKVPLER